MKHYKFEYNLLLKAILFVVIIVTTFCYGCRNNKKVVESLDANKDNFEYHWKLLSDAVNKNPKDTLYNCCTYSIKIIERESKIMGDADGTTFGKLYFTKNDWLKWDAWMKEKKK